MTKLTTGFRTYLNDGTANDSVGHFKLNADFLKGFAGTKPKFGFNGLGEFVFYRTYSNNVLLFLFCKTKTNNYFF